MKNLLYSYQRLKYFVIKTNKEYLISKFFLFVDCIWNCILGRCTIRDYFIYKFFYLNKKGKREFIMGNEFSKWCTEHNNVEMQKILIDKELCLLHFDKFVTRSWCGIKFRNTIEDYLKLVETKNGCICKPLDSQGGKGIHIVKDKKILSSAKMLREYCQSNNLLAEELIIQHSELSKLYPSSVNTIRIVTFNDKIIACDLRIGTGGKNIDNASSGGIFASIDINTGIINSLGKNFLGDSFFIHPDTKIVIPGFKIPLWHECIKYIDNVKGLISGIPVVGWDIAITNNGPTIVEINPGTEIPLLQLPHQQGLRKVFFCEQ